MKSIMIALLIIFSFSLISVVSAGNKPSKESPESFVDCVNFDIASRSTPEFVNLDQCPYFQSQSSCASCIISLEKQGCKVVDYIVSHPVNPDGDVSTKITYMLSCDGR